MTILVGLQIEDITVVATDLLIKYEEQNKTTSFLTEKYLKLQDPNHFLFYSCVLAKSQFAGLKEHSLETLTTQGFEYEGTLALMLVDSAQSQLYVDCNSSLYANEEGKMIKQPLIKATDRKLYCSVPENCDFGTRLNTIDYSQVDGIIGIAKLFNDMIAEESKIDNRFKGAKGYIFTPGQNFETDTILN